ncbi:MAG: proline--tRNA ligase [Thermodesulfovibrio sp. RBG_19FT_COMBO_41_18]|nr:MAG: proline--tRNA ligase [Thermodesulfovibrio sp. RBG_19FT_COMBO_41_18]
MYYSKLLIPTLREDPGEAEIISHRLMLRAGMIRKLAAGIYSYLPLGYRVIRKIENIVREEMNMAGAQEIFMPMVLPAELWRETGRWEKYGKELLRLKDRHEREFCLGPTHEEVVTDIVRNEVKSYRQLPVNLYQIQSKFRDEIRPRFGLMRGREFIMKDAYSFDADQAGAEESYRKMYEAYINIFRRCGLTFKPVEADTGLIGGQFSHEFMVLAETGEEAVASCGSCGYAANMEKAESRSHLPGHPELVSGSLSDESVKVTLLPMERRLTPGKKSVEDVSVFLGVKPQQLVKTLIVRGDDKVVAVLVRGDHELNGVKLSRFLSCTDIQLLAPSEVEEVTGAPSGFSGPVGLKGIPIIADIAVKDMFNFIVGGNERDVHLVNVNLSRDFSPDHFVDVRNAAEGDGCPRCDTGRLNIVRGIEVGHTFKLGTKYSEAMDATYLDAQGSPQAIIMGCYGIGVGRTMAAAIEQNHDKDGIIWPSAIAPFSTIILPLNVGSEKAYSVAREIYNKLTEQGTDVLLDDRDERAGVKFKDADLLGIPCQIVVGDKGVNRGVVEVKDRATKRVKEVPIEDLLTLKFQI